MKGNLKKINWDSKNFAKSDFSISSEAQKQAKDEKNLTSVLIIMSVLFVACQSIKIIPDIYELFVCQAQDLQGKPCKPGPIVDGIVRISHLMVCVNSSANFLIYYMYGSKFRKAWGLTYGPMWEKVTKIVTSQFQMKTNATEMKGKT